MTATRKAGIVERLRAAKRRHEARRAPTGFEFAFADRIAYVNPAHWDALTAGASVFASRAYLSALDDAAPENVSPRYAVAYYIGYDRAANETAPLYFRLLYAAVETSLAIGCRRISFGRTALEPRSRLQNPAAARAERRGPGRKARVRLRLNGSESKARAQRGGRGPASSSTGGTRTAPGQVAARALRDERRRADACVASNGSTRSVESIPSSRLGLSPPALVARPRGSEAGSQARMGARPVPLRCWVRHRVPVVNVALRRLLREVPHDVAPDRSPFQAE